MTGASDALLRAIDTAKAATPLAPLIGKSVPLRKRGRVHVGCCPFHVEQTPSFYVYPRHYHCFGCGVHGDVFDWLQHDRGLDLHDAVRFLGGELPDAAPADHAELTALHAARRAQREAQIAQERAEAIRDAARWWRNTVPIADTIGDKYLQDVRGIPRPPGGWPHAVRWLPGNGRVSFIETGPDGEDVLRTVVTPGAVIMCATTVADVVTAVQRIYLDHDAQNLRRDDAKRSKVKLTAGTFAPMDDGAGGAVVRLPGLADGPVLHAEGVETALSVWVATGYETRITLGNISGAELASDRVNVICRDDDREGSAADRQLHKALARWRDAGAKLALASPWPERRGDRSDFNDMIQSGGVAAVRARIEAADPDTAAPSSSPVARASDPRRSEIAKATFRMLRRGIPSAELLATLHRLNEQRSDPLPNRAVVDTALWVARKNAERTHAR